MKQWAFYIVYTLDLLANALFKGSPNETVSSRCYRLNHIKAYRFLEIVINAAFYFSDGPDHCKQSYENIRNGVYFPDGFFLDRKAYNLIWNEAAEMNAAFDKQQ